MNNAGSDEQRFLEASMAYVSGNPILNDEEFDKLKLKLKVPFPLCFTQDRYIISTKLDILWMFPLL